MREFVRVIGGPMAGEMVHWTRSVVVVRRPVILGWVAEDEIAAGETFTYARFSRPSGSFYAPHDWTWDQIERAMLDGYKGGQ